MSKSRRRYGWSLVFKRGDPDVLRLPERARLGLQYAQQLALAARERRASALAGERLLPEPLTVARLAATHETSTIAINIAIKHARIGLFGRDLSDSGIYYRLRTRGDRVERSCTEPGCYERLPLGSRRRYCPPHRTGRPRPPAPAQRARERGRLGQPARHRVQPLDLALILKPQLEIGKREQLPPGHRQIRLKPALQHRAKQRDQLLQPRLRLDPFAVFRLLQPEL